MFDNTLLEIVLNSVEFEILKSMGNTLGMELSVGHYGLGFFFFFNFFFIVVSWIRFLFQLSSLSFWFLV